MENTSGEILLRRRPENGLLGGMIEFPSTDWCDKILNMDEAIKAAPLKVKWQRLPGTVHHAFTHFHLELTILSGLGDFKQEGMDIWSRPECFADYALPTLMKKIVKHVRGNL